MKEKKLEEKLPDLVESPNEEGADQPATAEQRESKAAGHRSQNSEDKPKEKPKRSLKEFLQEFFTHGIDNIYAELSPADQKRYIERYCITISVGMACVLSSFFYWFLPPIVRVLVVPVFIGGAWWFGMKVVTKLITEGGTEQFVDSLKVVEFYQLVEAIKFTATTYLVAAIPFWSMPSQFQAAISNPMARTIFLSSFIWNLIGAPLYAQAKSRKARLLIILVFGVPAATVTLWWVHAIMLFQRFMHTFTGMS